MVPISIESYVNKHCKSNPFEEPNKLKQRLIEAVNDKKNVVSCFNCGQEIWAIGSAVAYQGCFTCITGEADASEDYEIDEVLVIKTPTPFASLLDGSLLFSFENEVITGKNQQD